MKKKKYHFTQLLVEDIVKDCSTFNLLIYFINPSWYFSFK